VLLQPHFDGTLAVNHLARLKLVSLGAVIDKLMSGTISATLGLTT
jgi:arachidonate 15-lipoxygenase